MPRVNRVQRARKDQGTCDRCSVAITVGDSYIWWKQRYGPRRVRCLKSECYPRRSELTSSEIYAAAWDACDEALAQLDSADDVDALETIQEECASSIGEIVEMLQEKCDNIEAGFGHTDVPVWEELDERRQSYEDWQNEVENVDFDGDFDEAAVREDVLQDIKDGKCDANVDDELQQRRDDWLDEQRDKLRDAVEQCPE